MQENRIGQDTPPVFKLISVFVVFVILQIVILLLLGSLGIDTSAVTNLITNEIEKLDGASFEFQQVRSVSQSIQGQVELSSDPEIKDSFKNGLNSLALQQTVWMILSFLGTVGFALIVFKNLKPQLFKPLSSNFAKVGLVTTLSAITWMLWVNFLGVFNQGVSFPESMEASLKQAELLNGVTSELLVSHLNSSGLFLSLLVFAIIPAICEELLFRGVIQNLCYEMFSMGPSTTVGKHFAIFLTAIMFSALHMQFYGFLPRFALGLVLGYSYLYTGQILIPIIAHFVYNSSVVYIMSIVNQDVLDSVENPDSSSPMLISALGTALLTVGYLHFLKNQSEKKLVA